jgi:uncharacterized RDD family membrane protein YckC
MAKLASPTQIRQSSGSRAAEAAARVAARYAQVPSYSQMLAAEVHSGSRTAGIAAQAARRAQAAPEDAAAQAAFASLLAAPAGPRLWKPEVSQAVAPARTSAPKPEPGAAPVQPAEPHSRPASLPDSLEAWESAYSQTRWEPDLRLLPLIPVPAPAEARAPHEAEGFASSTEDSSEKPALTPALVEEPWGAEDLEPVEPALPIHANLIEFPREFVATRKMRPRRAEGPFAVEGLGKQLSIFEVDPGAISTEVAATGAASAWPETDWSGIELEAQSLSEPELQEAPAPQLAPELASIGRRLMAVLVDGALIAGVGLGSALLAAASIGHAPGGRIVALGAAAALLLVGMIYQTLFLTLAEATPGMRCARISLCTFDGQFPTLAQVRSRLGALLLSVVPVGLGVAWALFDDDHLCWHDRLSRTYLRKG